MGIESRDYVREDPPGESFLSDTPTLRRIIIATVLIYLVQLFSSGNSRHSMDEFMQIESPVSRASVTEQWLSLNSEKVLQGQIWRLVTYALLHDRFTVWHILINMVVLFWFGRSLELNLGSREFMLFYIVATIVAGLAFVGIQLYTGDRSPAIGASGAVMAVFCLFALWNPGYTITIYFLFPVPAIWLLGLYILYDLHPLILQITGGWQSGIAHAAHLGGAAFGYLYYRRCWKLDEIFSRIVPSVTKSRRASPNDKRNKVDATEDQLIDKILTKVGREGQASLSDKERAILMRASQRYRDRER